MGHEIARRLFGVESPPNKPMQPTGVSLAFIRKSWMLVSLCAGRLIASVRRFVGHAQLKGLALACS